MSYENERIDRVKEILHELGDPQKAFKIIHVTGTNGKGSTSEMIYRILIEAGYRTATRVSIGMTAYDESFINGVLVNDEVQAKATEILQDYYPDIDLSADERYLVHEAHLIGSMLLFKEQQIDYFVLEVGMGWHGDHTNILDTNEVSVLTMIGNDHPGNFHEDLEFTAREKSCIFRPECHVVTGVTDPKLLAIIEEEAQDAGALKTMALTRDFKYIKVGDQRLSYTGNSCWLDDVNVSLPGDFQLQNAAVAIATIEALRERGTSINDAQIVAGLMKAENPGRFEILGKEVPTIVDFGKNPESIKAMMDSYLVKFPNIKPVFLFANGTVKIPEAKLFPTLEYAKAYVMTQPPRTRATNKGWSYTEPEDLCKITQRYRIPSYGIADPYEAYAKACELAGPDGAIVVYGSIPLIWAIRAHLLDANLI